LFLVMSSFVNALLSQDVRDISGVSHEL
jgi:hypothetical protein